MEIKTNQTSFTLNKVRLVWYHEEKNTRAEINKKTTCLMQLYKHQVNLVPKFEQVKYDSPDHQQGVIVEIDFEYHGKIYLDFDQQSTNTIKAAGDYLHPANLYMRC